jgi:hypothetical protein
MASKKYDLCVVTGEYQNRDGETKKQYKNIGCIMQNDNGHYMILDRTFNPAGLPNPDDRSSILVSLFEPRDDSGQKPKPATASAQPAAPADDYVDDVPF